MKNRDDHHHRSPDERAQPPERDDTQVASRDDPRANRRDAEHGQWKGRLRRGAQMAAIVGQGAIRSVSGALGEPAQMRVEPVVPTATQSQMIEQEIPVSTRPTAPPPQQAQAHVEGDPVIDDEPAREKREPLILTNRHDLGAAHAPPPPGTDDPFVPLKSEPPPDSRQPTPSRPITPER